MSELLDKWCTDKITELVITNKVAAEVVHTLFRNTIRDVLYLIHKVHKSKYKPTEEELSLIGDITTARNLARIVPNAKLDELVRSGELYFSIESILKDFKANQQQRDGLHTYYNHAVSTFQGLTRDLAGDLLINVITPELSSNDVQELAFSIMRMQQLDVFDAFHIASSTLHGCNDFATLDSDFIHSYYSKESIGKLRILKVA